MATGAIAVIAAVSLLAACSSSGGGSSAGAGGSSSGSGATSGGSSGGGAKGTLTVAFNSTPDPSYLPLMMAIDTMKGQGYNVKTSQTQSDSTAFQLMSSNRVQFLLTNLADGAAPVSQGAPLKAVLGAEANATTWVAAQGYDDCSKLSGKPVGIYAPNEGYTLIQQAYFDKACPGVKPNLVVIPDSALRAQALASGKILGSVLGTSDAFALTQKYPQKHFVTVNMGTEVQGAGDSYIWTNTTTISKNGPMVNDFLTDILKATRQIYSDPSQVAALATKYFGAANVAVAQLYAKQKLWYANGTLDGIQPTLTLYKLPGTVEKISDPAPLNTVIGAIGRSPATTG